MRFSHKFSPPIFTLFFLLLVVVVVVSSCSCCSCCCHWIKWKPTDGLVTLLLLSFHISETVSFKLWFIKFLHQPTDSLVQFIFGAGVTKKEKREITRNNCSDYYFILFFFLHLIVCLLTVVPHEAKQMLPQWDGSIWQYGVCMMCSCIVIMVMPLVVFTSNYCCCYYFYSSFFYIHFVFLCNCNDGKLRFLFKNTSFVQSAIGEMQLLSVWKFVILLYRTWKTVFQLKTERGDNIHQQMLKDKYNNMGYSGIQFVFKPCINIDGKVS